MPEEKDRVDFSPLRAGSEAEPEIGPGQVPRVHGDQKSPLSADFSQDSSNLAREDSGTGA